MSDTKSSQIAKTFLWQFSWTFGLAYSPLNSATLSCSSEVTLMYRQSSAYTVLSQQGFLNSTVYFGTLNCPFSTKSLLCLHGFLLTRLFFQNIKKTCKQRTPCTLEGKPTFLYSAHRGLNMLILGYLL